MADPFIQPYPDTQTQAKLQILARKNPGQASTVANTIGTELQTTGSYTPPTVGPHAGKIITGGSGIAGSGKTTVTYSDGTSQTLGGSRPIRNNNPGNLVASDLAVGNDGKHSIFPTPAVGVQAMVKLLSGPNYRGGNRLVENALTYDKYSYAPTYDNNVNYIGKLQQMGVNIDFKKPFNQLTDSEFNQLVQGMIKVEGGEEFLQDPGVQALLNTAGGGSFLAQNASQIDAKTRNLLFTIFSQEIYGGGIGGSRTTTGSTNAPAPVSWPTARAAS